MKLAPGQPSVVRSLIGQFLMCGVPLAFGIARAGEPFRIEVVDEVERRIIAKRFGRITGAGIICESQKLGEEQDWSESGIVGCDSVQNAVLDGRLFWLWGDTSLAKYPLGIFDGTAALEPARMNGDR